jgi:hypothetical protein
MDAKVQNITRYSKYWRVNRSRQEVTELALALRAMRKAAGYIGRNVKPVLWKGMAEEGDDKYIFLDPDLIRGIYPIPHRIYDALVGQVVFEGLSAIEFNEWVKAGVIKKARYVNERNRPYLESIIDAAQAIYIHHVKKQQIWSLYLSTYFSTIFPKNLRDPMLPPTPAALADIWIAREIKGVLNEKHHPYYEELLEVLGAAAKQILSTALLPVMTGRREARVFLYVSLWDDIARILSQWQGFDLTPDAVNLYDEGGPKARIDLMEDDDPNDQPKDLPEDQKQSGSGLDPKLAEDVRTILDERSIIRQSIAVAVQEPGARPMETRIQNGRVKSDIPPDIVQVLRMKKIFQKQETLVRRVKRKRNRRGMSEGKLDARRLYRVPLDGKVFKDRQRPGSNYFWQICIVADASASMSGKEEPGTMEKRMRRPWEITEKSFVSLAAAAKGKRNLLDIYAYRAERNVCILTRLLHDNTLYSVVPAGRTPSGQAIMTAATLLDGKYGKRMIVHITDGAANCGLGLGEALEYCRKQGIDVVTLGCGCNRQTRDFLSEFFPPGHLFFLKSVNQLADGLEHLFAQRILKGRTRNNEGA